MCLYVYKSISVIILKSMYQIISRKQIIRLYIPFGIILKLCTSPFLGAWSNGEFSKNI